MRALKPEKRGKDMTPEEIKKKFRITGDFHTHTIYSRVGPYFHGKGTILQNAAAAALKGLRDVAITDHGPSDFYGLDLRKVPQMREDIAEAMKRFPRVKVHLGVEADIVDTPNGLDVSKEDFAMFDFVNAGYHYVPNCHMIQNWLAFRFPCPKYFKAKLRMQNTDRIIRALTSNDIRILTHPGDKAYIDTRAVAKACEETGTLVEINARHRHPDCEELKIFAEYDVKFIISSDAHRPEKVGRYAKSMALAMSAGITADRIVNIEEN